jgi:hypothetical protein
MTQLQLEAEVVALTKNHFAKDTRKRFELGRARLDAGYI